jgi:acetyl-CoA carboxylase beta subunit
VLSAEQFRAAALIFAEHEFLQKDQVLLQKQVNALQQSLAESEKMIVDYRTALRELEVNKSEADRLRQSVADSYREQLRQQRKKTRRRTILCTAGGIAAGIIAGIAIGR